eukprot:Clim_evm19s224 gene=Clim_evmTU19s224
MPVETGGTVLAQGTLEVKEDMIEDAKKIFTELARQSRLEDGCIRYTFGQDLNNPSIFTCFEEWRDKKAWEDHWAAPPFRNFKENVIPKLYTADGKKMKYFQGSQFPLK